MKDTLMYCLTNRVMMHDIARVCKLMGGNPIMSEELSELEDIIPFCKSILLNMGTPTVERFQLANKSCELANAIKIPIVLDPVGCGQSQFRLSQNLRLLKDYRIDCLKVNFSEAISLLEETLRQEKTGVNGKSVLNQIESLVVAQKVYDKFSQKNPDFTLVITGKTDIIISSKGVITVDGKRNNAARLIGTGCMLGGIIAASINKDTDERHLRIHESLLMMKKATEIVTLNQKGFYVEGDFHRELFNQLSHLQSKIYAITDEEMHFEKELLPRVNWMLKEGIDFLQYRNKSASPKEMEQELYVLRSLCHEYGTPLIVNDHVELAAIVKADGVHLGVSDVCIKAARKILGADTIIGATAKTLEQGLIARAEGADYLGVGALFPSPTKPTAIPFAHDGLHVLRESVGLPMFGIGGIKMNNITACMMQSLDGVALVSTLFSQKTEESMISSLQQLREKMRYEKWLRTIDAKSIEIK